MKSKVRFKYVDIYYFSRCLGIDKVPERGNNPLGMESIHFNLENIEITKKPQQFQTIKFFPDGDNNNIHNFKKLCSSTPLPPKPNSFRDHSEDDNESTHSVMSIDYTTKSLQPLNPMQRKKCLERAGVDVDVNEDASRNPRILAKLREERKQVGCKCSNSSRCDPSKCICSSESIPCQSDGNKFPCKCGPKCANGSGKRVYSHAKIRHHYQHTFNRNLRSTVDIDIDNLSTVTGDCATCSSIPEETWKAHPETYHQTRSRKRAGDSNIDNHNPHTFKPMMTVSEVFHISPTGTNGNGHIDDAPFSDITDNHQPPQAATTTTTTVTHLRRSSSQASSIDKENIDATDKRYLSPVRTQSLPIPCPMKTVRRRISATSPFVSPIAHSRGGVVSRSIGYSSQHNNDIFDRNFHRSLSVTNVDPAMFNTISIIISKLPPIYDIAASSQPLSAESISTTECPPLSPPPSWSSSFTSRSSPVPHFEDLTLVDDDDDHNADDVNRQESSMSDVIIDESRSCVDEPQSASVSWDEEEIRFFDIPCDTADESPPPGGNIVADDGDDVGDDC